MRAVSHPAVFTMLLIFSLWRSRLLPAHGSTPHTANMSRRCVTPPSSGPQFTVLTLNLAKVTEVDQIVRELRPADILLFQEVVRLLTATPERGRKNRRKARHERPVRLAGSRQPPCPASQF